LEAKRNDLVENRKGDAAGRSIDFGFFLCARRRSAGPEDQPGGILSLLMETPRTGAATVITEGHLATLHRLPIDPEIRIEPIVLTVGEEGSGLIRVLP
jgi:hypothetical protein